MLSCSTVARKARARGRVVIRCARMARAMWGRCLRASSARTPQLVSVFAVRAMAQSLQAVA